MATEFFDTLFTAKALETQTVLLDALEAFTRADRNLVRRGQKPRYAATRIEISLIRRDLQRGLDDVAARTALRFDSHAKQNLKRKQVRPDTGTVPHLRTLIKSRPIKAGAGNIIGAVGLASIQQLDKAINPIGSYGPYWRAQEFGTGGDIDRRTGTRVKSQKGRKVTGYFFGKGGAGVGSTPNQAEFRDHPVFISGRLGAAGRGPRGGKGRRMVIGRDIEPKRFLRDAVDTARVEYARGVGGVQRTSVNRMRRIS